MIYNKKVTNIHVHNNIYLKKQKKETTSTRLELAPPKGNDF